MIGFRSAVSLAVIAFYLFPFGGLHRPRFPLAAATPAVEAIPALTPGEQGPQADGRQGGAFAIRFDGVPLTEFIQTVGPMLGFSPIRIDPEVQGRVTIEAANGISKEAVRRIFDGVLNNNHAVLRKSGAVYRVTGLEVPGLESGGESATPKPPQREPMRVNGNIQASRLIVRVEPVYPDLALRARMEATSLLEVTINEQGDVAYVRVMRSGHPLLQQAAVDAVTQWSYLPTCINGEAVPVVATVAVPFSLPGSPSGGATAKVEPGVTEGTPRTPVRVMRGQQASRLAYMVEPDYSQAARKEHLVGSVWLDVTVDEFGQVSSVKFLCGHPLVEQAVIDAFKQWRYVPAVMKGSSIPIVAVVNLHFDLRDR
jgi:protein TonB